MFKHKKLLEDANKVFSKENLLSCIPLHKNGYFFKVNDTLCFVAFDSVISKKDKIKAYKQLIEDGINITSQKELDDYLKLIIDRMFEESKQYELSDFNNCYYRNILYFRNVHGTVNITVFTEAGFEDHSLSGNLHYNFTDQFISLYPRLKIYSDSSYMRYFDTQINSTELENLIKYVRI